MKNVKHPYHFPAAISVSLLAALSFAPRVGAQPAPLTAASGTASAPPSAIPVPSSVLPGAGVSQPSAPPPAGARIDDPALVSPPRPPRQIGGWREAMETIRTRSTDLAISLADVTRAEAQTRVALAAALPTLGAQASASDVVMRTVTQPLSGDAKTTFLPENSLTYGGSLNLSVPIFAPRAWYAMGTADRNLEAARLSALDQRRILAANVASALVSVVTAERIADLNRVGLRAALERLVLTRRRVELGAANGLDAIRIEQDAASARATIVTGDETLRQARENLGLALGFAEQVGIPPSLDLATLVRDAETACPRRERLEERPDIVALTRRADVSRRGIRDVELAFLPTASLDSGFSVFAQPFVNQVVDRTITSYNWSVSATLRWNIFDGGIRYGNLRDARAQVLQADARLEAAKRAATVDIARANRGVAVADDNRKVSESARDLAKETDRLARLSFELGKGTSLDLVDAARALRAAEIQLALKDFDVVQAKIRAQLVSSTCEMLRARRCRTAAGGKAPDERHRARKCL